MMISRQGSVPLLLSVLLASFMAWQPAPAQNLPSAIPFFSPLSGKGGLLPAPSSTRTAPQHAPVALNSQILFQVYSAENHDAQDRADLANLRLADALKAIPDSALAKPPTVTVDSRKSESVLLLDQKPLLTVTDDDAANYHETSAQLASAWADTIQKAFAQALRERQPAYLRHAAIWALLIVLVGALIHLAIHLIARRLLDRPGWPVLTLLWIIIIHNVLNLFPQTRAWDNQLSVGVFRPVTLFLLVGLATAALARIWSVLLRHLFPLNPPPSSAEERTERTFRRRATLGAVIRVTGVAMIWVVAFFVALSWSGVNLSALLTSAGLIGVIISLAAQDTMKDIVAGLNILTDDRFGVGDTIQVGEYEGKVERLDLRYTQIRDNAGRLITLPNRNIAQVANLTSRWAQVDFKVGVSYFDDLEQAQKIMVETAQALAEERPGQILEPPNMLGVDAFNESNITLRMLVKTTPGDQWAVARELRARVKAAFDAAGITILNALHPSFPSIASVSLPALSQDDRPVAQAPDGRG